MDIQKIARSITEDPDIPNEYDQLGDKDQFLPDVQEMLEACGLGPYAIDFSDVPPDLQQRIIAVCQEWYHENNSP